MKNKLILLGAAMVAVLSSCSKQSNQSIAATETLCDDPALAVFVEIQRAIAGGDYESFTNNLGRQLQVAAKVNPQGMRMEFGNMVLRYGDALGRFFERDNYICINDYTTEEDTPRVWNRVYFIAKGKSPQLVFPSKEILEKVAEVQKEFNLLEQRYALLQYAVDGEETDEVKQLEAKMKDFDKNVLRPADDLLQLENMPKDLVAKLTALYPPEQLGLNDANGVNADPRVSFLPYCISKNRKTDQEGESTLTYIGTFLKCHSCGTGECEDLDEDGECDKNIDKTSFGSDTALTESSDGKWGMVQW